MINITKFLSRRSPAAGMGVQHHDWPRPLSTGATPQGKMCCGSHCSIARSCLGGRSRCRVVGHMSSLVASCIRGLLIQVVTTGWQLITIIIVVVTCAG